MFLLNDKKVYNLDKGATPREFCGVLVQTILKLVLGNLTHAQHSVFEHLKDDITLNVQRENKLRPLIFIA